MLKSLPLDQRPRERLARYGGSALSTVELLAILLRSGSKGESVLTLAQKLLSTWGSLSGIAQAPITDLISLKGMGEAKAMQLKAALTLATRLDTETIPSEGLHTPEAVFSFVKPFYLHEKKEKLSVICQDTKGHVLHFEIISIGTLNQTLIHPREVFAPALHHQAASIILIHNHPSGDPTPSPQDLTQTERLLKVSHMMGIPLNDHLIITDQKFLSLRQHFSRLWKFDK